MDFKSILSQKNVGLVDKNLRLAAGAILGAIGLYHSNLLILGIAALLLITGTRKNCPLYSVLKINTDK